VRTTTLPDGREAATVDFVALPVKATIKPDGQVRFEDPDAQLKRNATADPQDDTADLTRADPVTEAVQAIGGLLGGAAPDVIQGLVGAVSGAVNGAIQGAAGAAGGAVQGAAGAANGAIQGAVGAVNGAAGALTGALNAVGGAVNGTLDPDGDGDIELTVNPTLSLTLTPFSLDPTLQLAANPTLSPTRQSTLAASTLAPSLSGVLSPTKQPSLFEGVSTRETRGRPVPPHWYCALDAAGISVFMARGAQPAQQLGQPAVVAPALSGLHIAWEANDYPRPLTCCKLHLVYGSGGVGCLFRCRTRPASSPGRGLRQLPTLESFGWHTGAWRPPRSIPSMSHPTFHLPRPAPAARADCAAHRRPRHHNPGARASRVARPLPLPQPRARQKPDPLGLIGLRPPADARPRRKAAHPPRRATRAIRKGPWPLALPARVPQAGAHNRVDPALRTPGCCARLVVNVPASLVNPFRRNLPHWGPLRNSTGHT
jgi:hypothetical protein